jgi:hypothetical protein
VSVDSGADITDGFWQGHADGNGTDAQSCGTLLCMGGDPTQ